MENQLALIQSLVKAPKSQFNSFGKYKFRSAEDILEAVKQVVNPMGYSITVCDTIINIGDRYYIKATATLTNGKETWSTDGFAREEESKKGMDGSQVTGACSSYARKYALNGLFALDDTKDSDATNTHVKDQNSKEPIRSEAVEKTAISNHVLNASLNSIQDIKGLENYYKRINSSFKLDADQIQLFSNRKQQLN